MNISAYGWWNIEEVVSRKLRGAQGTGLLFARDLMKGTSGENLFTGEPERYIKQGSEIGVCFHWGPVLGAHGGALLS